MCSLQSSKFLYFVGAALGDVPSVPLCVYMCVHISTLLSGLQVLTCLPEPKWAPPEMGAGRLWASQARSLQDSEISHLPSQPSDPGQVHPFVFAFSWVLSLQVTRRIKGLVLSERLAGPGRRVGVPALSVPVLQLVVCGAGFSAVV